LEPDELLLSHEAVVLVAAAVTPVPDETWKGHALDGDPMSCLCNAYARGRASAAKMANTRLFLSRGRSSAALVERSAAFAPARSNSRLSQRTIAMRDDR
jgi:hypothetical protein